MLMTQDISRIRFPRPVHEIYSISSGFGVYRELTIHGKKVQRVHWGYDFKCPRGTPVRAVCGGRVYRSGWQSINKETKKPNHLVGFGMRVWQESRIGNKVYWIFYGHLDDIWAHAGRLLNEGDFIGTSGNTGSSTGPHLHFEVRLAHTLKRVPVEFFERRWDIV